MQDGVSVKLSFYNLQTARTSWLMTHHIFKLHFIPCFSSFPPYAAPNQTPGPSITWYFSRKESALLFYCLATIFFNNNFLKTVKIVVKHEKYVLSVQRKAQDPLSPTIQLQSYISPPHGPLSTVSIYIYQHPNILVSNFHQHLSSHYIFISICMPFLFGPQLNYQK